MRTNIDLDEELVQTAMRYAPVKTKRDLVHLALREFVENHRRKDLRGEGGILPDYDHKALRERGAERSWWIHRSGSTSFAESPAPR